jgi:hypothetical protein
MLKNSSVRIAALTLAVLTSHAAAAASHRALPKLTVSANHRYLIQENGRMFFYLADTAWELFHRLNREEAIRYLDTRARQGYTAIQAVALSELDGISIPNAYGDLPLVERDPTKPAVTPGSNSKNQAQYDYWDHVDYIIDQANQRGIYVALLPTWGRWVVKGKQKDETIFTPASAQTYGEFLGKRFRSKGIIWILGGDRKADGVEAIWRAMAKGIAIGVSGREDYSSVLMSFHPSGGGTSSAWFHNDQWLDFNMRQDGHGIPGIARSWDKIAHDYALQPPKPVIDGEPLYEDHPLNFNAKLNGYSFDAHVRQYLYWDLFSGACGHTYGNHAVWQMYAPGRKPVNGPLMYWYEAIQRPGAGEMQYARKLLESRPSLSRVPDQTLIADALEGADHIAATRGDGYAFIYSAQGRAFTLNLGKISGNRVKCSWFNPRSGDSFPAAEFDNSGAQLVTPPSQGFGSDWVLVVDDASKKFTAPGRPAS